MGHIIRYYPSDGRYGASTRVTTPVYRVFSDFSDYMEINKVELTAHLIGKHVGFLGHLSVDTLLKENMSCGEIFSSGLPSPALETMYYKTTEENLSAMIDSSQRLDTSLSMVARVTILHGLVEEMQQERYIPEL